MLRKISAAVVLTALMVASTPPSYARELLLRFKTAGGEVFLYDTPCGEGKKAAGALFRHNNSTVETGCWVLEKAAGLLLIQWSDGTISGYGGTQPYEMTDNGELFQGPEK